MKKLKLFSKTYIFTMILMIMIIFVSHTLLYMFIPRFYNDKKQNELSIINEKLIGELENSNSENANNIVNNFAQKYKLNITLTIDGKVNIYEGISQVDVYIDSEEVKNQDFILSGIEDNIIDNNTPDDTLDNSSKFSNDKRYFKISNLSIVKNSEFRSLDGSPGEIKMIMTLQSVKEAVSVIFMILPYSIGVSVLISLIAAYIYTRIITDPIKKICEVTKEMENLNKDAYCEVYTGDEIEILAENINSLYSTLWNTIDNLEEEIQNVSKSEKLKVDFLRSASHELKTPLMSIHIMLENMVLNIGKYKNHDIYLTKCKDEVNKLSNMVHDILNTSRLNTLNDGNEYEDININELLEEITNPYKIKAKYNNINMNIKYSKLLKINTDKKLLSKALSNVISNAVNYTDSGKNIDIYFDKNSLVIENQCKPIEKEDLEKIFEAFYRAEFDRNRNTGGNGLGLYIVKQILNTLNIKYSFVATKIGMKFIINFK